MKYVLLLCLVLIGVNEVGANLPGPDPNDPSDLNYLLELTPQQISGLDYEHMLSRANYIEEEAKNKRWMGMAYTRYFKNREDQEPWFWGGGGDVAIFTGFATAAAVYRYVVTRRSGDLDILLENLRGLHILTHVSGVPGLIARHAYPIDGPLNARFFQTGRTEYVFDGPANIADPFNPGQNYPALRYYARATRDQLTGILYGLSVSWIELNKVKGVTGQDLKKLNLAKRVTKEISLAVFYRLRENSWKIKDIKGNTGTSAASVNHYTKLNAYALGIRVMKDIREPALSKFLKKARDEYSKLHKRNRAWGPIRDSINSLNNRKQYFAWNLRFARLYCLFMLDDNNSRRWRYFEILRKRMWESDFFGGPSPKEHWNPQFAFLYFDALHTVWNERHTTFRKEKVRSKAKRYDPSRQYHRLQQAIYSLKAFSMRPLRSWDTPLAGKGKDFDRWEVIPAHLREATQHFLWQKEPFRRVGERHLDANGKRNDGMFLASGVDFVLPYWMGRAKFSNFEPFKQPN